MDIRSLGNSVQPGFVPAEKNPSPSTATGTAKTAAAPAVPVSAVQQPEQPPTAEQLTNALKEINKTVASQGIEFSVDSDSHRTVVKIVDRQTNQLIRQIPTKEALEIAKDLDNWHGLLINQKA
ncbi:flagellar protein FlaG [Undibacterium sp.]|jgi:flagellar protein FlaG|uniref:flagellar protein FlaG n=1 Tax=Undibacterium sp. TaxID=1914977 RepID=UPI002B6F7ECB|nr:flagellar protein FlaG [Undibacterium sp.]HTD06444.1 flagellar protein FlaG [Undibacterium sp.]